MHNHFPQNLSILRRQAGYTQETLAETLGVSRQAVGKWESGQALPEAATLLTLADLLGCTLD
ncbi:MAG: helix-turn-helix transcriptional regulator, partial [Oscillospiraceae bacterium]|nr:helix-turn-helix transcriptional regulator [Oscillospiraceae bacterium]